MVFLDFHHHKKNKKWGIYNLDLFGDIPSSLFSVGLHPKDISKDWEQQLNWVKETSRNANCFAIGECGLDALTATNEQLQKEIFQRQIDWASEIKKPIIIHCVKRFYELIPFQKTSKVPLIIHGFNKKRKILDDLLPHDFYFSFGKAALQNVSLQNCLESLPNKRFFLETDNADFPIEDLYKKVAEIKKTSLEELTNQQLDNLERIKNG